jgi:hypothetical protein
VCIDRLYVHCHKMTTFANLEAMSDILKPVAVKFVNGIVWCRTLLILASTGVWLAGERVRQLQS